MRAPLFATVLLLSSLAGAVAACSSTTTTEEVLPNEPAAEKADAGKPTANTPAQNDTGSAKDPPAPEVTGDDACAAEASQDACFECCSTNHPGGAKVIQDAVIACGCDDSADAGATCQTQCAATLCAATPSNPDQACMTCLQNSINQGGACYDPVGEACSKSQECMAEQTCFSKCPSK